MQSEQEDVAMKDNRRAPFPDARADIETSKTIPDTPQTRAPAYRLAFADDEFLCRDELRPVRLQLELLKPEMALSEEGIQSTIVMFRRLRNARPAKHNDGGLDTFF